MWCNCLVSGDRDWTDAERAALTVAEETVPPRYTRVAGLSLHGDAAWIVLSPERDATPEERAGRDGDKYGAFVEIGLGRDGDGWSVWHHSVGGGHAWWRIGSGELGVVSLVDEAPAGARAAEVRFLGEV